MIEILAYHGWGFDDSFWDKIKENLPKSFSFKAANRGYFGKKNLPTFSENADTKVLFAHSFGTHWVNVELVHQADYLVLFNAFDQFINWHSDQEKRERKMLHRMIRQFKRDPDEVLKNFYAGCFHPFENTFSVPLEMNEQLLSNDLESLKDCLLDWGLITTKVIGICGAEDQIVPYQRTNAFFDQLGVETTKVIENSGHALPITNSSDCWSFLNRVVPIFREYAERNESE
jgi:pimeloyl-ACP methyl ester carboxylesterase